MYVYDDDGIAGQYRTTLKKYRSPEVFMPEQFLREDGALNGDSIARVFGFGRRMWCVDAHTRSGNCISDDMMHIVQGDMLRTLRYGLR